MKKMRAYFRDLLETLKRIEKHLELLASCVRSNDNRHGDRRSISSKHWNDWR